MNTYTTQAPYIAAFVLVFNAEGKVAFVLRKNTKWMNGFYGLPAGKVEIDESYTAAAIRETKEEIGIRIKSSDLEFACVVHRNSRVDDVMDSSTWIDMYFTAHTYEGDPYNAEPDLHESLEWFEMNDLPENVIPSVKVAINAYIEGKVFYEYGWN